MKYLNLPLFLGSFVIGICIIFFIQPQKRIIHVYPTSENENMIQYKDQLGVCFKPVEKKVDCPSNPKTMGKIKPQ